MRVLVVLLGLLLVAGCSTAWGQRPRRPDDAIEQANKLFSAGKPDSALRQLHSTLYHLERTKPYDVDCTLETYIQLAKVHYHQAQFDSAQRFLKQAAELAHQHGYIQQYGHLQSVLGAVSRHAYDPVEAVRALRKATAIARQTRDSLSLGNALGDLSNIYEELGASEQSLKLLAEARAVFQALDDSLRLGVLYYNLGGNFEQINADSMLHYRRLAYELVRRSDNHMRIGEVLCGLGHAHEVQGNFTQAIEAYRRALVPLQSRPGTRSSLFGTWAGLMGAYLKTGRSDSARFFSQQLTEALALTPFPPPDPKVHLLLARYFEEVGLLPQSIRHFNTYTNQTDLIRKAHQSIFTQIIGLENQLETEHLRQEVLSERIQEQNDRQWAYGVAALVLALLLAVAVAVALRFRQLKRRLARSLHQEGHTRAELQLTNAQLLEMTHFRELLLGTIVHDLKTPLNSILGLAMLPPSERNLELIFQSGKRMLAQVHDLLDIQRLEQAQLHLNVQPCRVDELLEQAVAEVLFEAQQRRIDIAMGWMPDRAIVCDSGLLVRVLVNLLTNAIKFSPQSGTLEFKAIEVPEGLGFQVLDQGPGIPDHLRLAIFEPYNRVQGKSLGKARSTGLGLTFCKLAVEAHGGRIGVENRPTGGACFSVVLPQPAGTPVATPRAHRFMDAEPS